jgi:uncharacterized protein YjaZ
MPTRTGYVYGYYKVKEYLEKNNLKIKDIIGINWEEILKYNAEFLKEFYGIKSG